MRRNIGSLFLFISLFLFVTGCVTMQNKWEEAASVNTIEGYKSFLSRYPKGKLADEGRAKLEELRFDIVKKNDTIESYKTFLDYYPEGRFSKDAKEKMDSLVKKEIDDYQDALANGDIKILNAFLKKYGGSEYPQFSKEERDKRRLEVQKKLIEKITLLGKSHDQQAAKNLIDTLAEYVSEIKDTTVYNTSFSPMVKYGVSETNLSTCDGEIRRALVNALGEIRDKTAVPILIQCLRDPEQSQLTVPEVYFPSGELIHGESPATFSFKVRHAAAEALRKITGVDYGQNPAKWQEWWEENKERFGKEK
jgi:hypothetical protein